MKIRFYDLIIVLVLAFCGYGLYTVYNENKEERISIVDERCDSSNPVSIIENIHNNFSFLSYNQVQKKYAYNNLLMGTEREIYTLMEEKVYSILPQKDASGLYYIDDIRINGQRVDDAVLKRVFRAFQYDNPRIFWLSNVIEILKTRDSTTLKLKSVVSLEECLELTKRLNLETNKIIKSIPKNLSEYEREILLHDLLIERCRYEKGSGDDGATWRRFTIVGAILDGEAVCEGFAKAMQDLFNSVGIECRLIIGQKGSEAHMWNIVRVNGAWYHLDATWDGGSKTGRYRYFNLNDDMVKVDHEIYKPFVGSATSLKNDKYNFKLPKCSSTQENYIYKNGLRLDLFSKETDNYMIAKLKEAIKEKRKNVYIIIGKGMKFDDSVDRLFRTSPFKFFEYLREIAKDESIQNKVDNHKIYFSKYEFANVVGIELNYV